MSTLMPTLLIDTNVWVDNYCLGHVHGEAAKQLLRRAYQLEVALAYPAPIVKDVFYLLTHEYKRDVQRTYGMVDAQQADAIRQAVWGCVNNMCELAQAVSVGEADVWKARKYRSITGDLEDNLVLVAAERAKADFLVTNDQQLITKSTVAALTPEDMLSVLEVRYA